MLLFSTPETPKPSIVLPPVYPLVATFIVSLPAPPYTVFTVVSFKVILSSFALAKIFSIPKRLSSPVAALWAYPVAPAKVPTVAEFRLTVTFANALSKLTQSCKLLSWCMLELSTYPP